MARIGYSVRRTLLFFYGWTLLLAGLAVALRFIPYSDGHGHLRLGWSILVGVLGLIVLAASVYLIYVLEIFRWVTLRRLPKPRPDAADDVRSPEASQPDQRPAGEPSPVTHGGGDEHT
jgi:UDP-GlcNAc:undecaprenyl-phosphate GlcNAc-1-phosphate transferase